jgi:hypothetical protein
LRTARLQRRIAAVVPAGQSLHLGAAQNPMAASRRFRLQLRTL